MKSKRRHGRWRKAGGRCRSPPLKQRTTGRGAGRASCGCSVAAIAAPFTSRQGHSALSAARESWLVSRRAAGHAPHLRHNHRPAPGFSCSPYAIAVVELDEGPRMMTNMVGCQQTPEALSSTCRSMSRSRRVDETTLPVLQPTGGRTMKPGIHRGCGGGRDHRDGDHSGHVADPPPRRRRAERDGDAGLRRAISTAWLRGRVAARSPTIWASRRPIVDGTSVGGCSFMLHVRHAAAAINEGLATTILVTHGESGKSRVGAAAGPRGRRQPPGPVRSRPSGSRARRRCSRSPCSAT